MFDKSQGVLEVSCEEILSCIRDKLDPGNLSILSLYLQEICLLVYEKRKTEPQSEEFGWKFRDVNKPEVAALWQSDFKYIMQQYARVDISNLQHLVSRRASETQKQQNSPLQHMFTLCSLHNLATKLALTDLAQSHKGNKPLSKQASKHIEVSAGAAAGLLEDMPKSVQMHSTDSQRKWYKEACDCYLF